MGKKRTSGNADSAINEDDQSAQLFPGIFLARERGAFVHRSRVVEWLNDPSKMLDAVWKLWEEIVQFCEQTKDQNGRDITHLKSEFRPDDGRPHRKISFLVWILDELNETILLRNSIEDTPFSHSVLNGTIKALWRGDQLDDAFIEYATAFRRLRDWCAIRKELSNPSAVPLDDEENIGRGTATPEQVDAAIAAALDAEPGRFPKKETTRRYLKELFGEHCTLSNERLNRELQRARKGHPFEK